MHQVSAAKLVTPPSQEVISLTSLKTFLRIDGSSEDALLTSILKAATKRLEKLTDKKFVTQTWEIYYNCFPQKYDKSRWWDGTREMPLSELYQDERFIRLPFGPLQSVSGFYTYTEDNTEFEFASSNYTIDTVGPFGQVALNLSSTWPSTVLKPLNGIKITCMFGYGSGYIESPETASQIPEDIQEAVKNLAAVMYEHRGDELPKIPKNVQMLLDPYMRVKI